ncbi:oxidoreductase [Amycolatopsis acidicola]|uniref:Oxidoreductase n=1 Tax=Amycolatopsis acidicola TaxID=2596893 RepID=A0A5N0UVS8_9PSEU|nr:oxidoreductase [Amycolatopsis acidicola]KAA9156674.1 oxidoreductase [Amycolatopsis acidicola]
MADGPGEISPELAGTPGYVRTAPELAARIAAGETIEDVLVEGVLDLRTIQPAVAVRFERCRFELPPDVRGARLPGLEFHRCYLPGLRASNLRVRGDLRLSRCEVEEVDLRDAAVEGSVWLDATRVERGVVRADRIRIGGALFARRLRLNHELRLRGARIEGDADFSGAQLVNPGGFALEGTALRVGGSLLGGTSGSGPGRERFTTRGILALSGAKVGGDVLLHSAVLASPQRAAIADGPWNPASPDVDPWPALTADRIQVDGDFEVSDGSEVTGTVRLADARVGGSVRFAGALVEFPRGSVEPSHDCAIRLDGAEIGRLDATSLRVPSGELRMTAVVARGDVELSRVALTHPGRDAVSARRASIGGNLVLRDATVQGSLRFPATTVAGSVDLRGTAVSDPEFRGRTSFSVDLSGARVGGDVRCAADAYHPFRADGGVDVSQASVAGRVEFDGAELGSLSRHEVVLDARGVRADEMRLVFGATAEGRTLLRGAQCRAFVDSPVLWANPRGVALEDFRYETLPDEDLHDRSRIRERIHRLGTNPTGYWPESYDQLAGVLSREGLEREAGLVLFAKQSRRYRELSLNSWVSFGVRLWSWAQRAMTGYGYRPGRAFGWAVVLVALFLAAAFVPPAAVRFTLLGLGSVLGLAFVSSVLTATGRRFAGSLAPRPVAHADRPLLERPPVREEEEPDEILEGAADVDAYLDTEDFVAARGVLSALDDLAALLGYERPEWEELERGSWWRRAKAGVRKAVTSEELTTRLVKVERALEVATLDRQQAEVDVRSAEAVGRLLASLQEVPQACVRAGSIMLVKYPGEHGPVVLSRTLSQLEIAAFERFPEIQSKPRQALEALATAVVSLQEDEPLS